MSGDWSEDPDAKAYLARAQAELLPMISDCGVTMTLWTGSTDPKIAIELGYMILLDKPIIGVVIPGVQVPEKLARVVDEWVEGSPGDPGFGERLQAALARLGARA